jgi:hypothetical protein
MRALVLAVPVVVLLAAPAAQAQIEVGQGMAGARLGMSKAQVRAALGAPDASRTRKDIFGSQTTWTFQRAGVRIAFRAGEDGPQALGFSTTRRVQRTASGVGVGSSRAQVRRGVPGVRCERFVPGDLLHCHVGRFEPGRTVTDFVVDRRGRVARVELGVVID